MKTVAFRFRSDKTGYDYLSLEVVIGSLWKGMKAHHEDQSIRQANNFEKTCLNSIAASDVLGLVDP
jgi:hypothetical protein